MVESPQGDESHRRAACCLISLLRDFKGITRLKKPFTILGAVPYF